MLGFFLLQCSVSCGDGKRTRQIRCRAGGAQDRELRPAHCDSAVRPNEAENCTRPDCPVDQIALNKGDPFLPTDPAKKSQWKSGTWTEVCQNLNYP